MARSSDEFGRAHRDTTTMARMDQFGRALGNGMTGMTGMMPTPRIQVQTGYSKQAYNIAQAPVQDWRHSYHSQLEAGPTAVYASPTITTPSETYTPFIEQEFTLAPALPDDPLLDQFIDFDGLQSSINFTATHALSRSPSQKRQIETLADSPAPSVASFQIPERKRQRRITDGYACSQCPKIFDLQCEATKHQKQAHQAPNKQCSHCNKKFHWPKDVKRHLKQVHHIWVEKVELLEAPNLEDIPSDGTKIEESYMKQEAAEETLQQNDGGPRPPTRRQSTRMSISRVVTMMRALNLMSSKDDQVDHIRDDEKEIFITSDSVNWRTVSFSGIQTVEKLRQKILDTLPQPSGNFILHQYHPNGQGKRILMSELLNTATRAATDKQTLKVILTRVVPARTPTTQI